MKIFLIIASVVLLFLGFLFLVVIFDINAKGSECGEELVICTERCSGADKLKSAGCVLSCTLENTVCLAGSIWKK